MSALQPCRHCGEPLPAAATTELFCCAGCAAAAQWIEAAELADYYRLRTQAAGKVDASDPDFRVWDRIDLQSEHALEVAGGREITVLTDGMRCAACAWLIDRALSREPGVVECSANAVTGRIRLVWDPVRGRLSDALARLASLGYRPFLAGGAAREQEQRRQRNRELARIGVAALGAMQAMMLAEVLYLDIDATMDLATRDFFRWITLLVSTPVVFYAGWPFILGAWRELRHGLPGMDTLVAFSSLLALFASAWETVQGGPQVWYDAAVMFVFLLLAARMLEARTRLAANAQVDALARARPAFATRITADGAAELVPLAALDVGDLVRVAAGEVLPADGLLQEPAANFEEALLTGESLPVAHSDGDLVYAGSLCRDRPVRLLVSAVGTHTRLSQLVRLVEQAQAQRPALARVADRIAAVVIIVLLLSSALVYFAWRAHAPELAFQTTLAMLVISCPCALSLAVPAAFAAAHGALARIGVLAVRPDALTRLARVTDIVFDKTGTLTDAQARLDRCEIFGDLWVRTLSERFSTNLSVDQALRIATALEQGETHPLATVFQAHEPECRDSGLGTRDSRATSATQRAIERKLVPGQGVEGIVDGRHWRLGQAGYAAGRSDDGALWLGDGVQAYARFCIGEQPRTDAASAINRLRTLGLRIHLASGDANARVQSLARTLGIDAARSRQSPQDKLRFVRGLQAQGAIVGMIGDGLNDAPVLAGADVSMSFGAGAALAQRSSDLVLTGSLLGRIPEAIMIARRTRRIVRQNFAWALGYNLLALPLAATGQVEPWLAALGMALSSLLVTLNSLRLARAPRVAPPSVHPAMAVAT